MNYTPKYGLYLAPLPPPLPGVVCTLPPPPRIVCTLPPPPPPQTGLYLAPGKVQTIPGRGARYILFRGGGARDKLFRGGGARYIPRGAGARYKLLFADRRLVTTLSLRLRLSACGLLKRQYVGRPAPGPTTLKMFADQAPSND